MKTIPGILALALLSGAGLADDGRQEQSPPPPADLADVFGLIDNAFPGLDLLSSFTLPDSSSNDCSATLTFGRPTTLPPTPDCGYDSVACPEQAGGITRGFITWAAAKRWRWPTEQWRG